MPTGAVAVVVVVLVVVVAVELDFRLYLIPVVGHDPD